MISTAESGLDEIGGMLQCTDSATDDLSLGYPDDRPNFNTQEGEDLVDLWFELVDAGYTEDEAFEMIEPVTPRTKSLK